MGDPGFARNPSDAATPSQSNESIWSGSALRADSTRRWNEGELSRLHFGDRQFSRLEGCLGEVGMEFAHFSRLRDEGGVRHLGIFRLDLNHGL